MFTLLSTGMEGAQEPRICLICSSPISQLHLGIDSCRACAVFYKRIISTNRKPAKCKGGEGTCLDKDESTSCRKCRYERFSRVLKKAFVTEKERDGIQNPEAIQVVCDPIELRKTTFIDHNTFLYERTCRSSTPTLDKIRWSYSLMCLTRKTAELGTRPKPSDLKQGDFDGSNINFTPGTYSMVVPNGRIFVGALCDFANVTFPEFAELTAVNKGLCIQNCYQQVRLMESTYRSEHYFPDGLGTYFASYTTIVNDESMVSFLNDCPFETNKQEVIEALKANAERTKTMHRELFHRLKPDDVEFCALMGLAFWNNVVAAVNEDLSSVAETIRGAILSEMHDVYKVRGRTDYASRLGELFCLLESVEEDVTLTEHDLEVFKLLNLFNEAFPVPSPGS
ncbi:hypothetical protein PMAYCL1PPCAC_20110 [Pristionchus mayeri]|uniref:Nuclear receptor n=1 Tax=Pristionchus mayeri TaxID=1317129 RepID=A0AAN5CT39_9BILA|nr:hypothetical protein PMAYCL1PPCAC_20110 [Pristionchus mayeri]